MDLNIKESVKEKTLNYLNSDISPILLYGQHGVGKFRFIVDLLKDSDLHVITPSLSVSELKSVIFDVKSKVNKRYLLVRDIENLSAQCCDVLLKLFEEHDAQLKIIGISYDWGNIPEALRSRFRLYVKWPCIEKNVFYSISKDELAIKLSYGSFEVFNAAFGDDRLNAFYEYLIRDDWPLQAISQKYPEILDDKEMSESRKICIRNIFILASRSSKYKNSMLKLALSFQNGKTNFKNYYYSIAISEHA